MVYIVPFILTFFGMWLSSRVSSRKPVIVLLCVTAIYMILLMGFRYRVGIDTLGYMTRYRHMASLDELSWSNLFDQLYEPAYTFIVAVCKMYTDSFWPVQLIMNAITTVCVIIFLYRNCKNVFVGMFFFLIIQWLYFSTEVMRESVAIGIFLLNFKNIEKKRWVRYYLFSFLSLSFHYSAILIWFIPFARYLRSNWLYIIACVGMLSITPLVENLNNMIHLGVVSSKVSTYVNQADVGTILWRIGEFIKTGIPAFLCLILYYFAKKENKLKPYILLQFLFCCGAFAIPIIFQRFTNYTTLFVTVALANYVTDKKVALPLRATLIGVICITQSYYYYSMVHTWIPYESIFDPVKDVKREEFRRIIW